MKWSEMKHTRPLAFRCNSVPDDLLVATREVVKLQIRDFPYCFLPHILLFAESSSTSQSELQGAVSVPSPQAYYWRIV